MSVWQVEGEAHVAGTPFGESDARNRGDLARVRERMLVFDLQAQQELAFGIQRPGIRLAHVLLARDPPDRHRIALASVTQHPLPEFWNHRLRVRIARCPYHPLHRFRVACMAEENAVDPAKQGLLHDPEVGAHVDLVDAENRQCRDNGRRAVAATRRPAIDQPLHERPQRGEVERAVLHLVVDVVVASARHADTLVVAAAPARVEDHLPGFEQLDSAIHALGLVRGTYGCTGGPRSEDW